MPIQLYMLSIVGPKPEEIPPLVKVPVCNYSQVELNPEALMAVDGPEGYLIGSYRIGGKIFFHPFLQDPIPHRRQEKNSGIGKDWHFLYSARTKYCWVTGIQWKYN